MAHPSAYQVIFTFGKHKGSSLGYIADTNSNYLRWLKGSELPELWRIAADRTLEGETVEDLNLPRTRMKRGNGGQSGSQAAGLVIKDKKTAAVRFPYDEEILNRIKVEIDGRQWNDEAKCWEFPIVHLPKVVNIFGGIDKLKVTETVKKAYRKELKRRSDLDEIRVRLESDLEIATQIPLYPFQRVGVEFVERAGGRAMVADAMGLGKTAQAIGFALKTQSKTLIVCPKSVTLQWAEEIKKFTGKNSTIWTTQKVEGHGNNQFHIINYDAVRKQLKKLLEVNWDLLVCDEATNLKNRRTLRAKSVLGSWKERRKFPGIKTKYVLFLTGTPILNRPIEAYYLLSFLDPQRFNSFYHFVGRYGGWKFEEPKNLEELHDRTKDVVIRRLKKQVLPELPDKQRNDLYIQLDTDERKEYDEILEELFRTWHFNGKATVSTMPKIQGFLSGKKIERAKEIVDEFLGADRAILIFSVYIKPLKELKAHYGDQAELLYGDTTAKERRAIVQRLVDGKSKVGLIGLHAGGMGLDGLQHVIDTVLFLNMDWVPGIHEQAEDRTHRIGQKEKVQIFYLICNDTIDEDMRALLDEKQKIIDTVADGKLVSSVRSRSTFKEFVQRLSAKHGDLFGA